MKILTAILFTLLLAVTTASAETVCQNNNGSVGACTNVRRSADTEAVTWKGIHPVDKTPFQTTEEKINEHGYYFLGTVTPAYDSATQKLGTVQDTFANNRFTRTWAVVSLTAEELAAIAEQENLNAELIALVAAMSYADIETHVNTTFSGLSVAQKNSLIKLYRVVLYLAKQQAP